MRYLIVSDIHANREALEAVLAAAAGEYDRVVCCGDLVGYGADPNAVVEWARANVRRWCGATTTAPPWAWRTWNGSTRWRARRLCGRNAN